MKTAITSLAILLIAISICDARIRNVPEDYQTIQGAIEASRAGDTVLVQPGVYEENLSISRSLVLGSLTLTTGDPAYTDSTVIDGRQSGSVVTISNNNDATLRLCGLTICNGASQEHGGGIHCEDFGYIILQNVLIRNNSAAWQGGGVWAVRIVGLSMDRVVIRENNCHSQGGGIAAAQTNIHLTDCSLIVNETVESGGGLYFHGLREGDTLSMTRVLVADNQSEAGGGGLYCVSGSSILQLDKVTITRSVCRGQEVFREIGAVGGSFLKNSIIYDNDAEYQISSAGEFPVSYCDIQGGWEGDSNIDSDPRFVDPDNGDYHLSENSPCIDAGDPNSPRDPDGTRADMGAFYFIHNATPEVIRRIPEFVADEDCGRSEIADLDTIFTDPNGDTLTYRVFGLEQLGLSVNEENVLSIEPALNFNGDSITVVVSAFDASDSASVSFLVWVTPVNDPPSRFALLAPEDGFSVRYDERTTFIWSLSSDPDGNQDVHYLFHLDLFYYNLNISVENDSLEQGFGLDPGDVRPVGYWWVDAISGADTIECDHRFSIMLDGSGSVGPEGGLPTAFAIQSVSPNPFNSSTTIRFGLDKSSRTELRVYGLDGRLVKELWTGRDAYPTGEHTVVWNAEGLPGGIYLLRLESDQRVLTTKAILLR